jgi:hypothetical protein
MLANRHPVALAEETALLDHLSNGRFHLGVGRGGPWVDLEVFGTGPYRYQHGLAEERAGDGGNLVPIIKPARSCHRHACTLVGRAVWAIPDPRRALLYREADGELVSPAG